MIIYTPPSDVTQVLNVQFFVIVQTYSNIPGQSLSVNRKQKNFVYQPKTASKKA